MPAEDKQFSETTVILRLLFDRVNEPITREDLCAILGLPDRTVRKVIEQARQEGLVIANRQDGKGYFLPSSKEDLEALYNQNQSRALAILSQQKHIRRQINGWKEL